MRTRTSDARAPRLRRLGLARAAAAACGAAVLGAGGAAAYKVEERTGRGGEPLVSHPLAGMASSFEAHGGAHGHGRLELMLITGQVNLGSGTFDAVIWRRLS